MTGHSCSASKAAPFHILKHLWLPKSIADMSIGRITFNLFHPIRATCFESRKLFAMKGNTVRKKTRLVKEDGDKMARWTARAKSKLLYADTYHPNPWSVPCLDQSVRGRESSHSVYGILVLARRSQHASWRSNDFFTSGRFHTRGRS